MTTDNFDSRVAEWNSYMQTPWGRLQNSTRLFNLRKHLHSPQLDILDVGGGNGVETLPLAVDGHRLTLLDSSAAMLADGLRLSAENQTSIITIEGSVLDLDSLVQANSYDLIVFHNVIQYLAEAAIPALLSSFCRALRPGGLLSLVTVNRHSSTLIKAIRDADFASALADLDSKEQYSGVFDHDVRVYDAAEMTALLNANHLHVTNHYGVRIFIDYINDNAVKFDAEKFAQIEALEQALSDRAPFKDFGRTFQLIATT